MPATLTRRPKARRKADRPLNGVLTLDTVTEGYTLLLHAVRRGNYHPSARAPLLAAARALKVGMDRIALGLR